MRIDPYPPGGPIPFLAPGTGHSWWRGFHNVGAGPTYGSWVQYVASTSADVFLTSVVQHAYGTTDTYTDLQIGTGGAGAEVALTSFASYMDYQSAAGVVPQVTFPINPFVFVAAGTRIAMRMYGASTAAYIALHYVNAADVRVG